MSDDAKLREIFDKVLAAAPAERNAMLDRECAGDADLRTRIEAMIVGAEDDHFLSSPTIDVDPNDAPTLPFTAAVSESPGSHIGPYKLLQLIGEGGFGSVFMAEQTQPVNRRVALKIVKLGMDTRQVVARFEQERQALAIMDHPHVAKVFDAGATPTGRPYFVMELCNGEPITSYCDTHNLSIDKRLALFVQVCQAVQHAHQKGLIHRDIKPSNILVATQDDAPHAKIIDFGIAKATASKLTEKTLFTEHRQLVGTPQYMSPEQAEGSLDIDTRTDVYSLGVLLYELLTGATPFDGKTLRAAAYAEIQRIIREVDPPQPSTRLMQSSDTIASVAARRDVEPKRLGTIVRGELDWIVMKSLEKDRRRRYESPGDMASDVQRYLAGDAVEAAPPSKAYRARKFLRRHKGLVTTVSAVGIALLLGAAGFAWQARQTTRERDNALRNEQVALTVNAFFADQILGRANPDRTDQGKVTTLKDAVDLAAAKLETLFADQPVIRATIHDALGHSYRGMGALKEAEYHFRSSFERRKSALGPDAPDTLKVMHRLATVHRLTNDDRAEPMLRDLIERRIKTTGPDSFDTCNAQVGLGMLLLNQRRFAEALPILETAYAGQVKINGEKHVDSIQTLTAISSAYANLKQPGKAIELAEKQVRLATESLGADHPDTTRGKGWLASLYGRNNRVPEAIEMFRQADDSERRLLGEDHPARLSSYTDVASALAQNKQFEEAISIFDDAIKIASNSPRIDRGTLANLRAKYGATLVLAQRYDEAEKMLLEAYPIVRDQFGPKHARTQQATNSIIRMYERWGAKPQELAKWRATTTSSPS